MFKNLLKTKKQMKQLKALCNKYNATIEEHKTNENATSESVLNYKSCILSMICVDDWTGKVYK